MQTVEYRDLIKIRERGQITLPSLLRKRFDWLEPRSIIEIKVEKEKLILEPITTAKKAKKQVLKTNWRILKKELKRIRSWGNQKAELSKFVIADRRRH